MLSHSLEATILTPFYQNENFLPNGNEISIVRYHPINTSIKQ